MKYEIRLSEMEFYARHGCYELERKVGGRFGVELVLIVGADRETLHGDDVSQLVNYLNVYASVERQMAVSQCTVERVALNIIEALKAEFPAIESVSCTVSKFAPPLGGKVGRMSVTIEG